ncbi:hypothetical protein V7S76_01725 [Aquirufa sp. ROCK2-A2]
MIYNQPSTSLNNKVLTRILFLFFVTITVSLQDLKAQSILNSPYSYVGMGELDEGHSSSNIMMSGLGVSNSNGIYSSVINPALLARNRYTSFEVGVNTEYKNLQDYRQRQSVFGGNYQSINITLPGSSRWTFAIGLRPYSSVQYDTKSYRRLNLLGLDSLIYSFSGVGNVNKLSFSNGFRISKEVYVGLEMDYLFGNIIRNVSTQNLSDGQYYKVQLENRNDYSDFTFKAGVAYRHAIRKDLYLNVGATVDLNSTMGASQIKRFAILDYTGLNIINADTLSKKTPFVQNLPVTKKFGISLERIAKWMIGIDYISTDWTKVENNIGQARALPVSNKWVIGGEYTPDFESVSSYLKRTTYRAGFSYQTTPYAISATTPYAVDMNFSVGAALPLRNLSYLNVSYQFGKRGTLSENNLEEQYHRITLGLTLSDLWFTKQKIN